MRDFQVGAHTANLHRPPWRPDAPIWPFLRALKEAGYWHEPMAVPHAKVGRFYFECYPHPALIGFFDLDRILRYKRRSNGHDEWVRLIDLVRSLSSAEWPIANIADFVPIGLPHDKTNEDMLDSILCAYVAAYWWRFGVERSSLIGDLSSGYMVTPHSDRTLEALGRTFGGRMNQPLRSVTAPVVAPPNRELRAVPTAEKASARSPAMPKCDWVYFANDTKWNLDGFCKFVVGEKLIVRTIHNKARIPVPNVLQLKAGERILLVYKSRGKLYQQLFACTIGLSASPLRSDKHLFDVFSRIEGRFESELRAAKFDPDPVIGGFTGICLSETEDLHRTEIDLRKPVAMMAIQRWDDVFPESG
jgi:hypothetical protein